MWEEPGFTFVQYLGPETRNESRDDSTSIGFARIFLPLFSANSPTRQCSFAINLSKRRGSRRDFFFYDTIVLAHVETRRERAKPTCVAYASEACRSTRVAAASWPTITELTPTVALRRIFTCHEQRTVFKRDDDRSVPPLREFFSTAKTTPHLRVGRMFFSFV